jgi:DNA/RNA endonuclease YhcR with UshA esterase domain
MTVVIWGDDRAEFGSPEDEFDGEDICVSGVVDTHEGIPQIAIDSPDDISVT